MAALDWDPSEVRGALQGELDTISYAMGSNFLLSCRRLKHEKFQGAVESLGDLAG